jgi:hypothetical protein
MGRGMGEGGEENFQTVVPGPGGKAQGEGGKEAWPTSQCPHRPCPALASLSNKPRWCKYRGQWSPPCGTVPAPGDGMEKRWRKGGLGGPRPQGTGFGGPACLPFTFDGTRRRPKPWDEKEAGGRGIATSDKHLDTMQCQVPSTMGRPCRPDRRVDAEGKVESKSPVPTSKLAFYSDTPQL